MSFQNAESAEIVIRHAHTTTAATRFACNAPRRTEICCWNTVHTWWFPKIGVSPNSSVLMGLFSLINHPFWGIPAYGKPPYVNMTWDDATCGEARTKKASSRTLACAVVAPVPKKEGDLMKSPICKMLWDARSCLWYWVIFFMVDTFHWYVAMIN